MSPPSSANRSLLHFPYLPNTQPDGVLSSILRKSPQSSPESNDFNWKLQQTSRRNNFIDEYDDKKNKGILLVGETVDKSWNIEESIADGTGTNIQIYTPDNKKTTTE